MLTRDRDLLAIDPAVFTEAAPRAQTLLTARAAIDGADAALSTWSAAPADTGVGPGHVAAVDGAPCEILALAPGPQGEPVLTLSRPRASVDDPPIHPGDAPDVGLVVTTFAPQLARAERAVLRLAGVRDDDEVLTPRAVVDAAVLLALRDICAHAATHGPAGETWRSRAEHYERLFEVERGRAVVRVLTPRGEAARRLSLVSTVRV